MASNFGRLMSGQAAPKMRKVTGEQPRERGFLETLLNLCCSRPKFYNGCFRQGLWFMEFCPQVGRLPCSWLPEVTKARSKHSALAAQMSCATAATLALGGFSDPALLCLPSVLFQLSVAFHLRWPWLSCLLVNLRFPHRKGVLKESFGFLSTDILRFAPTHA